MTATFTCATTIVDATPAQVFDLSLDADLHLESMAQADERLVRRSGTGLLGLGDEVTWSARHFGLRWRMTSRITAWERPHRFVDEQVRGPFASFRHEHLVEAVGDDVVMHDEVALRAPFGPLGRAVERWVLADYLQELIEQRNAMLKATAER